MVSPLVKLRNATKIFCLGNERKVIALDNLDLDISRGEFIVCMGPNGAGKSTLLRVIEGVEKLDSGSLSIAHGDDSPAMQRQRASSVVHFSQDPANRTFDKLTLAEHLLLSELNGKYPSFIKKGVNSARIQKFRNLLLRYERPDILPFLERPIADLSGGMRQAAAFIVALLFIESADDGNSGILLLDEPTSSLDVENEKKCLNLIKQINQSGITTLLVTHDPIIGACMGTKLIMINQGRVALSFEGERKANLKPSVITELLTDQVGESLHRDIGDFG
jgi:ABC-type uncharacterized transport system ATPase component